MNQRNTTSPDPVLNNDLLDQYRQRKSSLLGRLINAFLEECPAMFQSLRQSVETKDYDAVRMSAHTLKSGGQNLGAQRLAAVCQEMENAAITRNASEIEELLAKMGPEFFEAEQALRGELVREQGKSELAFA